MGMIIYINIRNLENSYLKPFFLVHNIYLYLCGQVEIEIVSKIGIKCAFKISDVQMPFSKKYNFKNVEGNLEG